VSEEIKPHSPRRPFRESIQPTYDSRETGPRFYVTSEVNGRVVDILRRES
jgi:hypothetical protein